MNRPASPQLDQAGRATCLALATFLHAMGRLAVFGLLLTALAVLAAAAATRGGPMSDWMVWPALALGMTERVLALRLAFDARLFAALASGGMPSLRLLDQALAVLGLRPKSAQSRGLAERVAGTRQLVMQHLVVLALQALLAGMLLVRGGHAAAAVAQMRDALQAGESLIVFPEGTRHQTDAEQLSFKSGLFHRASAHPGARLVPVWIDNLKRVLPQGTWLPVPPACSVHFGAPLGLQAGRRGQTRLPATRTGRAAGLEPSARRHHRPSQRGVN